jgi:hypothetical protein
MVASGFCSLVQGVFRRPITPRVLKKVVGEKKDESRSVWKCGSGLPHGPGF